MASSINSLSSFTNMFRLGGLATGLDTDQMVSDLMRAERVPLDKLYQKKQLAQWRQDAYRDIISILKGFQNDFMNSLKSSSNMLSMEVYKKFTSSCISSADGQTSKVVSATGGSNAAAGTHTIIVNKRATADEAMAKNKYVGIDAVDSLNVNGKSFQVKIGNETKTFTFDQDYSGRSYEGNNTGDL